MQAILSLTMGYFFGCINPAAFIGKKKNVDLKEKGTGNLGATNTALVLGRKAGYFVLIIDMLKSILAYKAAKLLFPKLLAAGLIAGIGVLLGHCFPVTMHFVGGKGLASFGGLVLAHSWKLFVILLSLGIIMAFVMDYGVYLAVTATMLFPIMSYLQTGSLVDLLLTGIAGGLIFAMHWTNLRRAVKKEDPIHVRNGLKHIFSNEK